MFVTTNLEKNVFVRPFKDENERQSRSAKAITSMFQNIANKSHDWASPPTLSDMRSHLMLKQT